MWNAVQNVAYIVAAFAWDWLTTHTQHAIHPQFDEAMQ